MYFDSAVYFVRAGHAKVEFRVPITLPAKSLSTVENLELYPEVLFYAVVT